MIAQHGDVGGQCRHGLGLATTTADDAQNSSTRPAGTRERLVRLERIACSSSRNGSPIAASSSTRQDFQLSPDNSAPSSCRSSSAARRLILGMEPVTLSLAGLRAGVAAGHARPIFRLGVARAVVWLNSGLLTRGRAVNELQQLRRHITRDAQGLQSQTAGADDR